MYTRLDTKTFIDALYASLFLDKTHIVGLTHAVYISISSYKYITDLRKNYFTYQRLW